VPFDSPVLAGEHMNELDQRKESNPMAKKKTRKKTAKTTECKPRTKTQIIAGIADDTGLSRKEVTSVFDSMSCMIKKDLGRKGPGVFTVPGLMKVKKKIVPRRPARKNVFLPLLNETRDIPAKPARKAVKVTPLKALKEMV
jgi:nucleoid DNA-binding protein